MPLVPDQIRLMADKWPDAVAYEIVDGPRLTFAEWDRRSNRVAHALVDAGIRPGDRVALMFGPENCFEHLLAYMGTQKAGAIAVVINVRFSPSETAHLLDHSEPAVILASRSCVPQLRDAVPQVDSLRLVVTADGGSDLSRSWDDFLSDDDSDIQADISDDAPADVIYTSGTTGTPKGLMARHRNAIHVRGAPEEFTGDYFLHNLPLSSQAAQSLLTNPGVFGWTVLFLPPPFDAREFVDAVRRYRPITTLVIPLQVHGILALDDLDPDDLSSLTAVTVGSAPIAPATLKRFDEVLPNARPQSTYSLTELGTGYAMMSPDDFDEHPDSVGRAIPPLEIRVVDPDTDEELPAGEVGEVVARIPGWEREYFREPQLQEQAWRGGWLHTGDLGYLTEDGFLYLQGRTDDVIIRGGYNVHPADTEQALYELDEVKEAAVVGVPDEVLGEEVVAFVVPTEGSGLTAEDVMAWCEQRLGTPKRPGRVEIVDSLPRTSTGKILRRELSEHAAA